MNKFKPFLATTILILAFPAFGMEKDIAEWNRQREAFRQSELDYFFKTMAMTTGRSFFCETADARTIRKANNIINTTELSDSDKINTLLHLKKEAFFTETKARIDKSMARALPELPGPGLGLASGCKYMSLMESPAPEFSVHLKVIQPSPTPDRVTPLDPSPARVASSIDPISCPTPSPSPTKFEDEKPAPWSAIFPEKD